MEGLRRRRSPFVVNLAGKSMLDLIERGGSKEHEKIMEILERS
jgi:hypothetical protein